MGAFGRPLNFLNMRKLFLLLSLLICGNLFSQQIIEQTNSNYFALSVKRDLAEAGTRPLVLLQNLNAANTKANLQIENYGNGLGILLDSAGNSTLSNLALAFKTANYGFWRTVDSLQAVINGITILNISSSGVVASEDIEISNTGSPTFKVTYSTTPQTSLFRQTSDGGLLDLQRDDGVQTIISSFGDSWFKGGNVNIGTLAPQDVVFALKIRGDADSDAADVTDLLTLVLTPNVDPTLATWDFTSTQSTGYTFDKNITVGGEALVIDTFRTNSVSYLKKSVGIGIFGTQVPGSGSDSLFTRSMFDILVDSTAHGDSTLIWMYGMVKGFNNAVEVQAPRNVAFYIQTNSVSEGGTRIGGITSGVQAWRTQAQARMYDSTTTVNSFGANLHNAYLSDSTVLDGVQQLPDTANAFVWSNYNEAMMILKASSRLHILASVHSPYGVFDRLELGQNGGTSGFQRFVASDNDQVDIEITTADALTFNNATGGYIFDNPFTVTSGDVAFNDGMFRLTDPDVSQPITSFGWGATTYKLEEINSATGGGFITTGLTDSDVIPILFRGYSGVASPTVAMIKFQAGKTNGATGFAALAAGEIAYQFSNHSGAINWLTIYGDGDVDIVTSGATLTVGVGNDGSIVSSDNFVDRTKHFDGDALKAIKKIKGNNGEIDHKTLPLFAQMHLTKTDTLGVETIEEGRSLGAMISVITKGIQQLIAQNDSLIKRIEALENK